MGPMSVGVRPEGDVDVDEAMLVGKVKCWPLSSEWNALWDLIVLLRILSIIGFPGTHCEVRSVPASMEINIDQRDQEIL